MAVHCHIFSCLLFLSYFFFIFYLFFFFFFFFFFEKSQDKLIDLVWRFQFVIFPRGNVHMIFIFLVDQYQCKVNGEI